MYITARPVFKADVCKITLTWSFRDAKDISDQLIKTANRPRFFSGTFLFNFHSDLNKGTFAILNRSTVNIPPAANIMYYVQSDQINMAVHIDKDFKIIFRNHVLSIGLTAGA